MGRKLFQNWEKFSEITEVDADLIRRLGTILIALSCGHELDHDAFGAYARHAANIFVDKYDWYRMPVTMHKILMHGAEVIKNHLIPIGKFHFISLSRYLHDNW